MRKIIRSVAVGPLGEHSLAFQCILVGAALLLPHNTFSRSAFDAMALIAPEWGWGAVMVTIGALQSFAVSREILRLRIAVAFVSGAIWSYWTGATIYAGWYGVLWAFGMAHVAFQTLILVRLLARVR